MDDYTPSSRNAAERHDDELWASRSAATANAIAATANVHGVPLLTYNIKDFQIIADEVDLHET